MYGTPLSNQEKIRKGLELRVESQKSLRQKLSSSNKYIYPRYYRRQSLILYLNRPQKKNHSEFVQKL